LNAFIEEAVLNSKALASTKADSKGRQGDVYNSVRREIEYVSNAPTNPHSERPVGKGAFYRASCM